MHFTFTPRPVSHGFKHQIRATCSYLGYPLLGDAKYGCPSGVKENFALHAMALSFPNALNPMKRRVLIANQRESGQRNVVDVVLSFHLI